MMIYYYQLYAKNIHLMYFWLFTENPVYTSATTKKKIRCSELLQLTDARQLVILLCIKLD